MAIRRWKGGAVANAAAYDHWDDLGMVFTIEEVMEWDPQKLGEARLVKLVNTWAVVYRKTQIPGTELPYWWDLAQRKMFHCLSWIPVTMDIPGYDKEKLKESVPELDTPDGKKITAKALQLDPDIFISEWKADAWAAGVYVTTYGRRASGAQRGHKGKIKQRFSNKLANAINNELLAVNKLEEALLSRGRSI